MKYEEWRLRVVSNFRGRSGLIRRCEVKDIDAILRVEQESFPDPYDRNIFLELLEKYPSTFLVAEEASEVVGYVAAGIEGYGGIIYSIAVAEEYRNHGIGRGLMLAVLQNLSNRVEAVYLQVGVENSTARNLYKSLSFVEIRTIRNYYSNGEDALLLKWRRQ